MSQKIADLQFCETWAVDFEYRSDPGECPWVVCMVGRELNSGREIRLWRDELLTLDRAPFDVGPNSAIIAYYAAAELGCFLELGWPLPANVIDLFAEHRVETNGRPVPCGNGLVGALAFRNLAHIDAGEKEAMRRLILDNRQWSESEQRAILNYCASDVEALAALWPTMAPNIDIPRALLRGRYMAAVAKMERTGIPVDVDLHRRLVRNWPALKERLIVEVDQDFVVFDGTVFKRDWFARYLVKHRIPWPRLPSGALALDEETFDEETRNHPRLRPLYELRVSLGKMRLTGIQIGADGRARCMLSAFRSVTGRNQPSSTAFIFGPSRWIRGLVREKPGRALAYLDWGSQEIAIAAGLSGDPRMIEDSKGDPHLAFAKAVNLVPADVDKNSLTAAQADIRQRCKAAVLGVNYGMTEHGLAIKAGTSVREARELLRLHKETYPVFWQWLDSTVTTALFRQEMIATFGWHMHVGRDVHPRSLQNFPMQANGAEMMRIAAIAATEAGIEVCCSVHDAFLISAPIDRIEDDVAKMRTIMAKAGRLVTGIDVRVDAKIVRAPDRYMDERGAPMWDRTIGLLESVEREGSPPTPAAEPGLPVSGEPEIAASELPTEAIS
jgi:DNA polymerase I